MTEISPTATQAIPDAVGDVVPGLSKGKSGLSSRRRGCHSADTASPSLSKTLRKGRSGMQQNDSLADG